MRRQAIPVLLRPGDRDGRATPAVEAAAQCDPDHLVLDVAARVRCGEHVRSRKMYERHASGPRSVPTSSPVRRLPGTSEETSPIGPTLR